MIASATQLKGALFPISTPAPTDLLRKITGPAGLEAYATLRKARSDKRLKGKRDARKKAKEEEEKAKK